MNADEVLQPSGKHYLTEDGQYATTMTVGEIDGPNNNLEGKLWYARLGSSFTLEPPLKRALYICHHRIQIPIG